MSSRLAVLAALLLASAFAADPAPQWFKGNLHTHSLWSDGDDYPEMIADWFKRNGWHFLAMSEHNVIEEGTRWLALGAPNAAKGERFPRGGGETLEKYLKRFGSAWVEQRDNAGKKEVRLKPLAEYRSLLEEPGRFLMIPGEEITSRWVKPKTATAPEMSGPVHINLNNVRDRVGPAEGDNALKVMQDVIDAVLAQRKATGIPMFAHLNHPNFHWGVTAEELMRVKGENFFEVYNGHPGVNNAGDAARLSTEQMWDVINTWRLTELNLPLMLGIGTDDSHHYHQILLGRSNAGRGWVMVRARHLTAESIVRAMEAGDFYASSGVTLADVRGGGGKLEVEIKAEPGVSYTTTFIGTRRGFDARSEIVPPKDEAGKKTLPHRRYSKDVGAVLAEVKGPRASYTFKGDEIFVRARITSTKAKPNASVAGEVECAWTQPVAGK